MLKPLLGQSLGQTGVAIFLAISGFLALQSERSPTSWLLTRLGKIYPPYWIATIIAFMAAGVTGYKSFTVSQVISQLAGTGLLTHRAQLVNVATWFVSLLLLLYLVVFFARLSKLPSLVLALLALLCSSFVVLRVEPLLSAHAATFFLAAVVSKLRRPAVIFSLGVSALLVLSVPYRQFSYPLVSLIAALSTLRFPPPSRVVATLSRYSYEFYLIHGVFLVGSQRFLGRWPLVSIPVGLGASLAAAVALQWLTARLVRLVTPKSSAKASVPQSKS